MVDEADADDRRWVSHVRPADWAPPTPADRYGLVVLGGGPAGLVAAFGAAALGVRVAMVERDALGGDCLNAGCVPSKAFLGATSHGFAAAVARARAVRADLAPHDSAVRLREAGVDVFYGEGHFVARDAVSVGGVRLRFARCLIATGSRPRRSAWMDAVRDRILTPDAFFALRDVPTSVVVVGGGAVGCELAQGLAASGVPTTLLVRGALLEREARDAVDKVAAGLAATGVVVRSGEVLSARPDGDAVALSLTDGAALSASHVLVAIGRDATVAALQPERADVATEGRRLRVDCYLRTTNPAVFAAGDVVTGGGTTHAADRMARTVLQNALFLPSARFDPAGVPRTLFTSPPLASVGVQSGAEGHRAIEVPFEALDAARCNGRTQGFARLWVDRRGRIGGATLVGEGAADLLAGVIVAMHRPRSIGGLSGLTLPYPTRGEVLRQLGDAWLRTRWGGSLPWLVRVWLRMRLGRGAVQA